MKTLISLAQMTIQLAQPEENFQRASKWVEDAARLGSQLILLPELWTTGYDLSHCDLHSEMNLIIQKRISALARDQKICVGGSLINRCGSGYYNTFFLFDQEGVLSAQYSKVHLFRLMDEEKWLSSGNCLSAANMAWGRTGLAICYDLRFPELFRKYALSGIEIILIPAEWPLKRIQHWETLLKARAIENQCFVAAVNTVGMIGNETFGGSSQVVNPWGEVLIQGPHDAESLLTAEVDLSMVSEVRNLIPIFKDRRPDIYESDMPDLADKQP